MLTPLAQWMAKTGTSGSAIGRHVGVSRQVVAYWVHGVRVPQLRHAIAIHALTRGAVTYEQLAFPAGGEKK
jgi:DNA-binding transcriptional regulator YdaS (Cro superfamily)